MRGFNRDFYEDDHYARGQYRERRDSHYQDYSRNSRGYGRRGEDGYGRARRSRSSNFEYPRERVYDRGYDRRCGYDDCDDARYDKPSFTERVLDKLCSKYKRKRNFRAEKAYATTCSNVKFDSAVCEGDYRKVKGGF